MQSDTAKPPEMTDDEPKDGGDWNDVLPPPAADEVGKDEITPPAPLIEGDGNAEEKINDDNLDIIGDPLSISQNSSTKFVAKERETTSMPMVKPYIPRPPPNIPQEDDGDVPDFSRYKTNVAERLWRAKKEAKDLGATVSPDLVPLTKEYQLWRKKMSVLNKYIDEYKTAMNVLSEKRNQLFTQYAKLSENTPLFDHIGKPLTVAQISQVEQSGDDETRQSIESRTKSVMEVADQIGPGSLMAHQQLSVMHEKLNEIDYQNHIVGYIDEWDTVVTSQLDDELKTVRELAKNRDKYIGKVDILRQKVNTIERKSKQDAPKKLTDQLDRNEARLEECDILYEKKANEVSVVLYEATRRGWVDLYPVIKNVMKFEINRLGRDSSTYGSHHSTLEALKIDYRDATKDTADAPNTGSAL